MGVDGTKCDISGLDEIAKSSKEFERHSSPLGSAVPRSVSGDGLF
jgi:hypothetical protein